MAFYLVITRSRGEAVVTNRILELIPNRESLSPQSIIAIVAAAVNAVPMPRTHASSAVSLWQ